MKWQHKDTCEVFENFPGSVMGIASDIVIVVDQYGQIKQYFRDRLEPYND